MVFTQRAVKKELTPEQRAMVEEQKQQLLVNIEVAQTRHLMVMVYVKDPTFAKDGRRMRQVNFRLFYTDCVSKERTSIYLSRTYWDDAIAEADYIHTYFHGKKAEIAFSPDDLEESEPKLDANGQCRIYWNLKYVALYPSVIITYQAQQEVAREQKLQEALAQAQQEVAQAKAELQAALARAGEEDDDNPF